MEKSKKGRGNEKSGEKLEYWKALVNTTLTPNFIIHLI
jgi:hypothetical protein